MAQSLLEQALELCGPEAVAGAIVRIRAHLDTTGKPSEWRAIARPEQIAPCCPGGLPPMRWDRSRGPSDWSTWAIIGGRGSGKTRPGAEWAINKALTMPGSHGALVGATVDDVRKTMLSFGLEKMPGASGILAVSRPDFMPRYHASKRILTWPNGSVATVYTAEAPERLRGPQHMWAWVDEIAAWAHEQTAWEQLLFGLRLGSHPQACVTTTPRAVPILRDLLADAGTVVSRMRTRDNAANLAESFLRDIERKYAGTRLGRQELDGELLLDVAGALWHYTVFDKPGVRVKPEDVPELDRVIVMVDPSGGHGEENDEQGIIVAGAVTGKKPHAYVLQDYSCKLTPDGWGRRAVQAFVDHDADVIGYETNYGGEMVRSVIENAARAMGLKSVPIKEITATRGKVVRAEPISLLYEQGHVSHAGVFTRLEDEQTQFVPGKPFRKSPNRADACVFAITDLMLGEHVPTYRRPRTRAPRRM